MTTNEIAVSVKDLHKEFILPQSKNSSFKQTFVNIVKQNNKVTQKVLDGISFDVRKGDFFGIVGRNGSGKSTLLKILAGVYAPTSGEVLVNGGLTPFIELGVGFNPELSGRDNVYLNGALLGFDRKQMAEMYDEIVEFAELEPFMDRKLKNYSSGMQVRLAFSIAIKAKNEVLIFDEVLAVGDEAFQRKCLDVFEKYKAEGQTVILVTHEMATVKKYCNRAILISEGELIEEGDPRKVADRYSELNQESIDGETRAKNESIANATNLRVQLQAKDGVQRQSFSAGEQMHIAVDASQIEGGIESIGIDIFKESGEHITGFNTKSGGKSIDGTGLVTGKVTLDVGTGGYYVSAVVFNHEKVAVATVYDGPRFAVVDSNQLVTWSGLVKLPSEWE